jgi:hypothetical protein
MQKTRHNEMSKFQPGHLPTPGGGRPAGSRNKITTHLLNVLCQDFQENGEAVVKICRIEKPVEYLKIISSLLPRELQVSDAKLADLSEDEIATLISQVRELRAQTPSQAEGALKRRDDGLLH